MVGPRTDPSGSASAQNELGAEVGGEAGDDVQGQADDVAHAAADALDEHPAGALHGVGAGLVERLAGVDVPADRRRRRSGSSSRTWWPRRTPHDRRGARRRRCAPGGCGRDSSRSIRCGVGGVGGLAEDPTVEIDGGVGGDHQHVVGDVDRRRAFSTASRRTYGARLLARRAGSRRCPGRRSRTSTPSWASRSRRRGEADARTTRGHPPLSAITSASSGGVTSSRSSR